MMLWVLLPALAGQQLTTSNVFGGKVCSLVPSISYRSLGDVPAGTVCACVVPAAINVHGRQLHSAGIQGTKPENCWETGRKEIFHCNHFVNFISHPCTYFTQN